MNRRLLISVALASALSLAACGSGNTGAPADGGAALADGGALVDGGFAGDGGATDGGVSFCAGEDESRSTVVERNLDRITIAVALMFTFATLALDLRLQ